MGTFRDLDKGAASAKGGTYRRLDAASSRKASFGDNVVGAVKSFERAIPFVDEGLDSARAFLTTASDIATGKVEGDLRAAIRGGRNPVDVLKERSAATLKAQRERSKGEAAGFGERHPIGKALVDTAGMAAPVVAAMTTGGASLLPALAAPTPVATGLLGGLRALGGATTKGATVGGLSGALAGLGGEGEIGERLSDANSSAAVGAVVGGVLPPALAAGAKGVNAAARAFVPQAQKEAAQAGRILAARAPEAAQPLPAWNDNVLPFERMGRGGESLARAVSAVPGPGQEIAERVLRARQAQAPERMMASTLRDLGDDGAGYHPKLDELDMKRLVESKPLYEEAFAVGPVQSAKLDDLSRRPSIRDAVRKAERLAREEGEDATALGLYHMENPGDWASEAAPMPGTPAPPRAAPQTSLVRFLANESGSPMGRESQMRKVARDLQQRVFFDGDNAERWATRAWEEGYFPGLQQRPSPQQVYEAIDRELRGKQHVSWSPKGGEQSARGGGAVDDFGPDSYGGRPEPLTEPVQSAARSMKSYDYIKRGLDELIEEQRDPITKRLPRTDTMRLMDQTRRELRGELVDLNPAYGPALAAYTGPSRAMDAQMLGRRLVTGSMDPEDVATGVGMMSKNELDGLKLGMARGLADQFRKENPQRAIRRFANDAVVQDRLRAGFNDDVAYGRFMDDVLAEAEAQQSYSRVLSGSRTTPLREDIDAANAAVNGGVERAVDVVARRLGGQGFRSQAVIAAVRNWERMRQPGLNNPQVSQLLADALFKSGDPEELLRAMIAARVITPEEVNGVLPYLSTYGGEVSHRLQATP